MKKKVNKTHLVLILLYILILMVSSLIMIAILSFSNGKKLYNIVKNNNIILKEKNITNEDDVVYEKNPILIDITEVCMVIVDNKHKYYIKFDDGQMQVSKSIYDKVQAGDSLIVDIVKEYRGNVLIDTYYDYKGMRLNDN
jgi:hypothetical protein